LHIAFLLGILLLDETYAASGCDWPKNPLYKVTDVWFNAILCLGAFLQLRHQRIMQEIPFYAGLPSTLRNRLTEVFLMILDAFIKIILDIHDLTDNYLNSYMVISIIIFFLNSG